jgi:3-deoxy-D-arabino-heptulosonate 7-phosphate (DAHP) synthase
MIQENRKVVGNLPTIDEVKEKYPLNEEEKSFMKDSREQVRNILT